MRARELDEGRGIASWKCYGDPSRERGIARRDFMIGENAENCQSTGVEERRQWHFWRWSTWTKKSNEIVGENEMIDGGGFLVPHPYQTDEKSLYNGELSLSVLSSMKSEAKMSTKVVRFDLSDSSDGSWYLFFLSFFLSSSASLLLAITATLHGPRVFVFGAGRDLFLVTIHRIITLPTASEKSCPRRSQADWTMPLGKLAARFSWPPIVFLRTDSHEITFICISMYLDTSIWNLC